MPKNIRDIIPPAKRSIRDIPIPVRRTESITPPVEPVPAVTKNIGPRRKRSFPGRKVLWAGLAAVVIIAAALYASFDRATLSYVPKTAKLSFSGDSYTAYQTPPAEGGLAFSVIKLSGEKSTEVPASGEETVSLRASGTVVIYNEQTIAQPLVKTTRLETPNGKIYRIPNDVTVPAKGSIETTAAADQPGDSYNVGLSDFTIPGFKGSSKYELVYARSNTAMSGGFVGTRKKVSEADMEKASTSLKDSLKGELLEQARAQMPEGFVLFPDLAVVTFETKPQESAGADTAKVTISGNLNAAIFKKADLSDYLAAAKLGADKPASPSEITDYSGLKATFASAPADLLKAGTISFNLLGEAPMRFVADEASLAADLAGAPKESLNTILERYPAIETASVVIRPFWKTSFPTDAGKIKIVEQ